ncbi:MAG: phosphoesterase [Lachnospiraceae bacterium]|nr:phosphoesterase [Lachnospiraceae bacterium]
MSVFFIADLHFDDERIIKYENRPFENVKQMNETIIRNWNYKVTKNDVVFMLGDIGNETYIKELNGKIYLIKGNHDTKKNQEYRSCGFEEVYDYPIIYENFWILSHEPMYINQNMPYANLFGHVHKSPQYTTYSKQHYCVTVERIDYTPIAFEMIKETLSR